MVKFNAINIKFLNFLPAVTIYLLLVNDSSKNKPEIQLRTIS